YSAAVDGDNNGLTFNAGNNIINFANTSDGGATLNWKNNPNGDSATTQAITTTGGTTNINFNNSGTIAGGVSTNGASATTTIAIANNKSGTINGNVTTDATNGTTNISFASGSDAKTLTLGGANNTLSGITFTSGSTGNIITLNNDAGTTSFASAISVGANDGITFNLNGTTSTTLTFGDSSGLTNNNIANFNFNKTAGKLNATSITTATTGITTFNLGSDAADTTTTEFVATITGALTNNATATDKGQVFNINAKNATLQYSVAAAGDNNGLTFSAGNNIINFANTSDGGATLNWKNNPTGGSATTQAITTTDGTTTINFNQDGTIAGGVSTNGASAGTTTNINVKNGAYAVINGAVITGATNSTTNINFSGDATASSTQGTLVIKGNTNDISKVSFETGDYKLSLTDAESKGGRTPRNQRRSLTIGTLDTSGSGSLTFISQATATEADTFVINAVTGSKKGTYHLGVVLDDNTKMAEVGADAPVRLVSVIADSGITFEKSVNVIEGFTHGIAELTSDLTNANGESGSDYMSYYIQKIDNLEVIAAEQEITATAFTLNYDLYMANLNSLNKRMGELRENNHSQGVWARVFNGALSNDFGLGSKSNYTTIQAGYDYAFGFEGANNYLGVALSYALSTSTSDNKAFDSN
ncbi:beta strand repeat-containing protein, partial [Helicobacter brantae]